MYILFILLDMLVLLQILIILFFRSVGRMICIYIYNDQYLYFNISCIDMDLGKLECFTHLNEGLSP